MKRTADGTHEPGMRRAGQADEAGGSQAELDALEGTVQALYSSMTDLNVDIANAQGQLDDFFEGAPPGNLYAVTQRIAELEDAPPQFGEDTSIRKGNAAWDPDAPNPADLKTIWQGIAAFVSNVAGAEESSYAAKVLRAGAQVVAQLITATGTVFPDGIFTGTPSASRASVAIGVVGTGLRRFLGLNALAFMVAGREIAYIGDDTANGTAHLRLVGTFARMLIGDDVEVKRTVDATSSQSAMQLSASFNGAPTDVVVGVPGVLANDAVGGFLEIGYCAGIPVGDPLPVAGKRPLCIGFNGEDGKWHLYHFIVGTGWGQLF